MNARPVERGPGAVLFGRKLRVEIGRWIARRTDPVFFLGEAQEAQPYKDRTSVTNELERLVGIGMLREEKPHPGQRRRYFRRTTSALWKIFETADEVLGAPQFAEA